MTADVGKQVEELRQMRWQLNEDDFRKMSQKSAGINFSPEEANWAREMLATVLESLRGIDLESLADVRPDFITLDDYDE
tara:strand:+ start:392 stop:628 length:237 start_codon:yes stop_codon:yes gene_type:complete